MVQEVLEDETRLKRLTKEDYRGLTLLSTRTSNPTGHFGSIWKSAWRSPELVPARKATIMTLTPPKNERNLLRAERPDYPYLKSIFRALREKPEIAVCKFARFVEIYTGDKHFYVGAVFKDINKERSIYNNLLKVARKEQKLFRLESDVTALLSDCCQS